MNYVLPGAFIGELGSPSISLGRTPIIYGVTADFIKQVYRRLVVGGKIRDVTGLDDPESGYVPYHDITELFIQKHLYDANRAKYNAARRKQKRQCATK